MSGEMTRKDFLKLIGAAGVGYVIGRKQEGDDTAQLEEERQRRITAQLEAQQEQRIKDYLTLEKPYLKELPRESELIGGTWVTPIKEATVNTSDKLNIAINASTPTGAPDIAFVVITASYPTAPFPNPTNHDEWPILGIIDQPDKEGNHSLLVDMKHLGLLPGQKLSLAFNPVNTDWQTKLAPQGVHDVYYRMGPRTS